MTAPAVEARGWGWRHPGRKAWALRGLDLVIEQGERVLLLGTSGSGKSTLLAGVAGLLDEHGDGESEGTLQVLGTAAHQARHHVGLVGQDPAIQVVMARAGDDVAFGLENRAVAPSAIGPAVAAALASVGLGHAGDRSTATLSGGELQRLAIAGVLALRPRLLLLDEPTAALDPDGAREVRALLAALARAGTTTVLVEHRIEATLPLVDRVVVIAPNGVIADGSPAAVLGDDGPRLAALGIWVPGPPPVRRPAASTAGPVLLTAEAVEYRHRGTPPGARSAVDGADLSLRAGAATALRGPNGAGKTTLALVLAGLLKPQAGTVRAGGELRGDQRHDAPARWRPAALAARIGTVFQNPEHQLLTGRVIDELHLGGAAAAARADDLLERLHLSHLAQANPFTLSGGEQRRLSVATALAAAPRVLVCDEPTAGQDRRTWAELVTLLADLRDDGRALLLVTHDDLLVDALADRTATMTAGRVTGVMTR